MGNPPNNVIQLRRPEPKPEPETWWVMYEDGRYWAEQSAYTPPGEAGGPFDSYDEAERAAYELRLDAAEREYDREPEVNPDR